MNLQISYITNRLEPRIEWFFDSLHHECAGDYTDINVLVVDFWLELQEGWFVSQVGERGLARMRMFRGPKRHLNQVPCKPNVWSGPHRLPKENWWSVCAMRNTALCHAPDGYIAFLDDRSVLMPGWLKCAREAMQGGYAAFGSYEKFENLKVKDGIIVEYGSSTGKDTRQSSNKAVRCSGQWSYGCNSVLPLEFALQVNGYDEGGCDGMGFEDVIFGLMLEKHGFDLRYDPRMKVAQDRTPNQLEPTFRAMDKGISPYDKSHAILNMVRTGGRHTAPNHFEEGGIRALRQRILAGGEFPIVGIPEHDWFDGQRIADMV